MAIRETVLQLGLHVRAGVHTGECERTAANLTGIAVHVAARIMSMAGSDEITASNTVKDLVAGSGIQFADRGRHKLKGVDREMQVWSVSS
jgi:class 3 adenylate cyclase